jgi:DNA ligase-1
MLATPVETEEEIFANFPGPFFVEDKYDGVRSQLHVEAGRSALYSRTLDEVSLQFPEITAAAISIGRPLIADGEIVAFKEGRVLPFGLLQQRLGRKKPSPALIAEIPAALMIFDVLSIDERTCIDDPLETRKAIIQSIKWPAPVQAAPFLLLDEHAPLEPLFEQAMSRRNEGLMLKGAASTYIPGKRGMSWLKWKKALATLDVVVTGVEFGHGRRRDLLSDYTFAIRDGDNLLNIGKAYSGLTDSEIVEMTEFFKSHTIRDYGRFRSVEPIVVIEVTFNGIQKKKTPRLRWWGRVRSERGGL